MAEIDFDKMAKDFRTIAEVLQELERTVLYGWPHKEYPTEDQVHAIVSVYNELQLKQVVIHEVDCWHLAGQIVARIARDEKERNNEAQVSTP